MVKLADTLTEAQWQSQTVALCRQLGWECFWAPRNQPTSRGHRQTVPAGFPDLVVLGHGRALFLELKTETGRIRSEQKQVLARLAEAGCECAVLRPRDLSLLLAVLGPEQRRLTYLEAA